MKSLCIFGEQHSRLFLLPPCKEAHFQESEFEEKRRRICTIGSILFVKLIFDHLSGAEDNRDGVETTNWFLQNFKLFNAAYIFMGTTALLMARQDWPQIRAWVCRHNQPIFIATGVMQLINLSRYFIIYRTLVTSDAEEHDMNVLCDNPNKQHLCPNIFFSFETTIKNIVFVYFFNLFSGTSFYYTIPLNVSFVLLCVLVVLPWEDIFPGFEWRSENFLTEENVICPVMYLVHTWISLALCYENEKQRRAAFLATHEATTHKLTSCRLLGTMIPDKIVRHLMHSRSTSTSPQLLSEKYDMVTVIFCQFSKSDLTEVGSAETFLQLVAKSIDMFDRLVEKSGLCKVENICEDYVIASSSIRDGATNANANRTDAKQSLEALQMVQLASLLVNVGNSVIVWDPDSNQEYRLHFKAGVHSGPLVGAVAGKSRRFYRLFGDTVNTCARMAQYAPEEKVLISQATFQLITLDNAHPSLFQHHEVNVKGKGWMETFIYADPNDGSTMQSFQIVESIFLERDETPKKKRPEMFKFFPTRGLLNFVEMLELEYHGLKDRFSKLYDPRTSLPSSQDLSNRQIASRRCWRWSDGSPPESARKSSTSLMLSEKSASSDGTSKVLYNFQTKSSFVEDSFHNLYSKVQGKLHKYRATFRDADKERRFQEDMAELEANRTKSFLVVMALVHFIFFSTLYSVLNTSSAVEFCSVGVVGLFTVSSMVGLYLGWRKVVVVFTAFKLVPSLTISRIALFVSLASNVYIVSLDFPQCVQIGLISWMIACCHHELPVTAMFFIVICFVVNIIIGDLQTSVIFQAVVLAIFAVLYRQMHCKSIRVSWILNKEVKQQMRLLDTAMDDLMPSADAKIFIRTRYLKMVGMLDDLDLSFSNSVFSMDPICSGCVLTSDLVGFTPLSQALSPEAVVQLLHSLWSLQDTALEIHKALYGNVQNDGPVLKESHPNKMDTVGDAYILFAKIPNSNENDNWDNKNMVRGIIILAQKIMDVVYDYSMNIAPSNLEVDPGLINMRMGLAVGQIVAGVVGFLQPRYHVYGDVVKHSANLESQSSQGCIKVCESTRHMFDVLKLGAEDTFCLLESVPSIYPYLDTRQLITAQYSSRTTQEVILEDLVCQSL